MIATTSIGKDGIRIESHDGNEHLFHFIWLRDNCRCDECGDPAIGRRRLRLTELDLSVRAKDAHATTSNELKITWDDGHVSIFPWHWLQTHSYQDQNRRACTFEPRLWDDEVRNTIDCHHYDDVANDGGLYDLLTTVRDTGLCFVSDAPAKPGILESLASRIGPVQESNFGRVQDLILDYSKRSVANRGIALKPHTDEPYRASPPGLLMFHCIATDVNGQGSSIFVDGFEIAERLREEDPTGFDCLTRHNQNFRRHFEHDVDLITDFPVISVDPYGNVCGVRINDRVAGPACIPSPMVVTYYRAMQRLLMLSEDENRWVQRRLKPGDIAVFDNHRILHGRTQLTMNSKRWLQWAQVNRGDFYSRLRVLADQLHITRDTNAMLRGAY